MGHGAPTFFRRNICVIAVKPRFGFCGSRWPKCCGSALHSNLGAICNHLFLIGGARSRAPPFTSRRRTCPACPPRQPRARLPRSTARRFTSRRTTPRRTNSSAAQSGSRRWLRIARRRWLLTQFWRPKCPQKGAMILHFLL